MRDHFLTLPFRQTVRAPVITKTHGVEFDKHTSKTIQQDVEVEDSWALETQGRVRPSSPAGPQLSGPKLHTAHYVVERDDAGGRSRGYVSTQDTHVHEIEKIQTQPSKEDDVFDNASLYQSTSLELR